jgi:DNA-binding response OmpR family regulator
MKTILIVEDEKSLQEAYLTKFKKNGYSVMLATSGDQGITLAQEKIPDLIILDLMLPGGIDGMNVLTILKNDPKTKQIPVIIMTNIEDQTSPSLDIGAVWYFVKSDVHLDYLVAKVKEILRD